jgi:hypothetical protein
MTRNPSSSHQHGTAAKLEGNLHRILYEYADVGPVTELVIRNGTFYDRVVWARYLAWAASKSDENFDPGEELIEAGIIDAENLRKTRQRLPNKIEKWLKEADIRIPA